MKRLFFYTLILGIIGLTSCKNKSNILSEQLPKKEYNETMLKIDDLYLEACTQKEIGNKTKALSGFERVIDMDSKYSGAYFQMAELLFSLKEVEKAIASSQKAIELSPNNYWYKLQLAEIYIKLSRWSEAAKVYEEIIKQSPETIEYYQELIEIYHNAKDEKNMISTLGRMEEKWGISHDISMFKFKYFTQNKDYKSAEKEIEKLIESFPQDPKYLAIMAEIKMNLKEYSKALEYYNRIEKLNPEDPFINVSLTNYYLVQKDEEKVFYYLKKAFENKDLDYNTKIQVLFTIYGQKVDSDAEVFNKFFSLLKSLSNQYPQERALWELLSTGYMKEGDFENSIYSLKKAISLGSNQFETYQNLLFALSTQGDADTMIYYSQKTIELFPEQPLPYLFLGVNYIYKQDYNKALETLLTGEKLSLDNKALLEDFYSNIGETYYKLNDYKNSDKYFDKTLEINPDNYVVLNNYAYYLSLRKENLEKAREMAAKVAKKYPDNPIYIDTYAWVLYELKEYKKAKEVMDSIIDSKNNWSETLIQHYEDIIKANK